MLKIVIFKVKCRNLLVSIFVDLFFTAQKLHQKFGYNFKFHLQKNASKMRKVKKRYDVRKLRDFQVLTSILPLEI